MSASPPSSEAAGSYRSILAATSMIGGASAINMIVGLIRAKVVAVLLGNAGMGVMGMYLSISGLATSLASCGLNFSGVRELAEARGRGDEQWLKQTRFTLWCLSWWLGVAGTVVLAASAWAVSMSSFGNADHTLPLAVLSLTVVANLLANYYVANVQAAGHMAKVATYNVISAVAGALVAILCFYLWGRDGIMPALTAGAAVQALVAWWLARDKNEQASDTVTHFDRKIAHRLLKVGATVMGVGLLASFTAVLVRTLVIRAEGESGAGLFQAAFGLSGMCATYILGAMGTDLLPRLSSAASDHALMTRLINDQTKVGMLLGLPGVVITMVAAPLAVPLLYSKEFMPAVPLLQLMAISVLGRILTFPLGFALIAKGASRQMLVSEISVNSLHVILLYLLLPRIGLLAAGWASIAIYAFYAVILLMLTNREIGFAWRPEVMRLLPISGLAAGLALCSSWFLSGVLSLAAGIFIAFVTTWLSLRSLASSANITLGGIAGRLKRWFAPRPPTITTHN